jgi:signal transduction histidine kinase
MGPEGRGDPAGRFLIFFAIGLNLLLTVSGFLLLYTSPYTGLRALPCKERVCIRSVDGGSPAAAAGIRPGDILLSINDVPVHPAAFIEDPDFLTTNEEAVIFWETLKTLGENQSARTLSLTVERNGSEIVVDFPVTGFPLLQLVQRSALYYLTGWSFLIISFLVLRKKRQEAAIANFIIGTCVCVGTATSVTYVIRDLMMSHASVFIMRFFNSLAIWPGSFALIHLILVFPRKKKLVLKYPWITRVIYIPAFLLPLLILAEQWAVLSYTVYLVQVTCFAVFIGVLWRDYFREDSPVIKRQLQWVLYGFSIGLLAVMSLYLQLLIFGKLLLPVEMFLLAITIPISLAIAITRHGLMEIESIFDYTVIYGTTVLVLVGLEMTFFYFISPSFADMHQSRFFVPSGVLIIVIFYIPIRNTIRRFVEKLFKRGDYKSEDELHKFLERLLLNDSSALLEKFSSFIKGLMGPSGIHIVNIRGRESAAVFDEGERGKKTADIIAGHSEKLLSFFQSQKRTIYGYELIDLGVIHAAEQGLLETVLFVPIAVGESNLYLTLLFQKWNGSTYSRKDIKLLDAISINMIRTLEAEELRREREEFEELSQRQKEYVMGEMHDGLGSLLTNITISTQVAEHLSESDVPRTRDMLRMVEAYSRQATDFLRTGLDVLDNTDSELGTIIAGLRHRVAGLFDAAGIQLKFETDEQVNTLRAEASIALNLIRCAQEAFNNILKHADAKTVVIRFYAHDDELAIKITDDGKGFDSAAGTSRGYGLRNIAARAEALGGSFTMESAPGQGASVLFTFRLGGHHHKIPR